MTLEQRIMKEAEEEVRLGWAVRRYGAPGPIARPADAESRLIGFGRGRTTSA